jgi:hypothetical protein
MRWGTWDWGSLAWIFNLVLNSDESGITHNSGFRCTK